MARNNSILSLLWALGHISKDIIYFQVWPFEHPELTGRLGTPDPASDTEYPFLPRCQENSVIVVCQVMFRLPLDPQVIPINRRAVEN